MVSYISECFFYLDRLVFEIDYLKKGLVNFTSNNIMDDISLGKIKKDTWFRAAA